MQARSRGTGLACCAAIREQLEGVKRLAKDTKPDETNVWLLTQVPVLGVEREPPKNAIPAIIAGIPAPTARMLAAWNSVKPKHVDKILAGDRHLFQVIEAAGYPTQVTVGTGGVLLDELPFPGGSPNWAQFATLLAGVYLRPKGMSTDPLGVTVARMYYKTGAWLPTVLPVGTVFGKGSIQDGTGLRLSPKASIALEQSGCSYRGFGYLLVEMRISPPTLAFQAVGPSYDPTGTATATVTAVPCTP